MAAAADRSSTLSPETPFRVLEDNDSRRETFHSCGSSNNSSVVEPIETDLAQRYWGPTREITHRSIISLLEGHAAAIHGEVVQGCWTFVDRKNGVYNVAYIFRFDNDTEVALRVPACGWGERWNDLDARSLRSTALTMRLIGSFTTVPVPKVITYDTSMENDIGSPFILMSCLRGQNARVAWSQDDGRIPKELRRQNLLRTLAEAISDLSALQFRRSGSLWFLEGDDNVFHIGDSWVLRVEGYVIKRTFKEEKSYTCTRDKVNGDVRELLELEGFAEGCKDDTKKGVLTLYQLMVKAWLDAVESPHLGEEFVLAHNDFDIQNLMTDHEGNVTGILDWDGVTAEPRQAGWAVMPRWLQRDWYPGYRWPPAVGVEYAMVKPDEYAKYREDYTRYLWEACEGHRDSTFTSKSHIHRALLDSTSEYWTASRFVQNVLVDILPRVSMEAYCTEIGHCGFRHDEKEWLEARLLEYFAPTAPGHEARERS
ncbi:hypothetical protein LTR37_001878 [Vermiconidia calcicola]|uniref:Uncharacterized protein n=1 Tax=Vermiconidia calcicola TaxID=1690605 RepID=A0ACC3NVR9_9PEZI|nr:hypothetical protein LTR37_001878 [Vermiconidia calcicola]